MKGNMIGEWVRTVFRIKVGSPKNLNDRFIKSCSKVRNMKQKTVLPASRFWSRKSISFFFMCFWFFIPPQVSFSEDAEKPSVAPHLIQGFRNYFAEDSYQLQDLAYQNRHPGSPPVSKKPACSATLSPTAGSVFARCGTRSKAGNKNSKGNNIFGGKPFPDYDYLKNYIHFGKLNGVQSPGSSEKK